MSSSLLSDSELIAACLSGDLPSWDHLLARYSGFIYALTQRTGIAPADVDDVFQNVCVRLYQNLDKLRASDRLSNWLAVTVRNEVSTLYRRRRNFASLADIPDYLWETERVRKIAGEEPIDPQETILALETQCLVRESLDHLPAECRNLLTLLYCEEPPCSYVEVSQRLGMPLGSIGPKRARCLQRLEKLLQKFGF